MLSIVQLSARSSRLTSADLPVQRVAKLLIACALYASVGTKTSTASPSSSSASERVAHITLRADSFMMVELKLCVLAFGSSSYVRHTSANKYVPGRNMGASKISTKCDTFAYKCESGVPLACQIIELKLHQLVFSQGQFFQCGLVFGNQL